MDLNLKPDAEKQLDSLKPETREKISEALEELSEKALEHKNVKLIKNEGEFVFRMKIGGRNQKFNHRAIFDIENGKIKVLKIGHRREIYK